ncbi:MAG: transketolase family protein [Patescibacteria group bacterium]|nr:transketolase family protein [Patescibacteria group bacterium]
MIYHNAKLREDLFEKPELKPTRDGFGQGLLELGDSNPRVVALCADLTESTRMEAFAKKYPARFVEVGVAEQNLATVGSGLANYGKIPFIASYATFSPGRNNEQIRTTISLNNVPVKIVGSHAGLSVGPDGATHQALEDMALMRVQPNMTVISPCDAEEARKATVACAGINGPVYLRLARAATPTITTHESSFTVGRAELMWESEHQAQVAIFATGPLVYEALRAARDIGHEVPAVVYNVHTIKPLDRALADVARAAGAVVVVEEHQRAGGLGGAVAELLAELSPVPVEFVGVDDRFGQSGEPAELLEYYGLTAPHIANKVRAALARKIT